VNKGLLSSFIIIVLVAPVALFLIVSSSEVAVGQAEETFSLNSTFFEETENQTGVAVIHPSLTLQQQLKPGPSTLEGSLAPMVVSGDNVFIVWSTNRTGNWEVMMRTSNDGGETFGDSVNLSNSNMTDSIGPDIIITGNNILVSWRENNLNTGTTESLVRISNDEGETFGPIMLLSTIGTLGESQSAPNYTTYENSAYKIQLQYPSDWEEREGDKNSSDDGIISIAGFYTPVEDRLDNYRERLWVSLDNLNVDNITLREYAREVIELKNDTRENFDLLDLDTENTILAGKPAYRIISTGSLEDGTIAKEMEIGTIIANKVYFLTYYAEASRYADYLPEIQHILNSLEINH
jgi:hypothetical protein